MNPTISSYKHINAWIKDAHVPMPIIFISEIVSTSTVFPSIYHHNIDDVSKLFSDDPHMVQLLIVSEKLDPKDINLLCELKFPLIVLIVANDEKKSGINVDKCIEILKRRNHLLKKWIELKAKDETGNPLFETQIERVLDGIQQNFTTGTVGDLSTAWDSLIQADMESLDNASHRFLQFKTIKAEALKATEAALKTDVGKKLKLESTALVNPTTTRHFAIGSNNHVTDKHLLPPTDGITEASITQFNEIELNNMKDPLSLFFRAAIGTTGYSMTQLFTKMPEVSPTYGNERKIEAYISSLIPVAYASFLKTDDWIKDLSRNKTSTLSILPKQHSSLFIASADLCGHFIREADSKNPKRSNLSRFSYTEHRHELNNTLFAICRIFTKEFGIVYDKRQQYYRY